MRVRELASHGRRTRFWGRRLHLSDSALSVEMLGNIVHQAAMRMPQIYDNDHDYMSVSNELCLTIAVLCFIPTYLIQPIGLQYREHVLKFELMKTRRQATHMAARPTRESLRESILMRGVCA